MRYVRDRYSERYEYCILALNENMRQSYPIRSAGDSRRGHRGEQSEAIDQIHDEKMIILC